jgi:hypothetical protein
MMCIPYIVPIIGGQERALDKMKFQDSPYSPKAELTMPKYTATTIMHIKPYKTEVARIKII